MKNILLIGDSILVGSNQTSGYGTIVRDMLKDKANVYIPLDNARYTMYTLRNLAGWIDAMPREKMDIVQWNNLEWDIGEFYQDGPLTPLPFMSILCGESIKESDYSFRMLKLFMLLEQK